MIYSLNGKLIYKDSNSCVIECGGVGYRCSTTNKTLAQLPHLNDNVFLYTYLAVREDSVDLYGFFDSEELDFFKLIISVSGIGPKIALSVLSDYTPKQIAGFISTGDVKSLSKANGLGSKKASRIILELKDKITGTAVEFVTDTGIRPASSASGEAIEALVSIGFTEGEASKAVARLDPSMSVEDIIKSVLKNGLQ